MSRLVRYAKRMRRKPTPAEARLHNALIDALRPYTHTLVFQEPISHWIADFMLYPYKVVIEADGGYHNRPEQQGYDERRTDALRKLGLTVLRYPNQRILHDTASVVLDILAHCDLQPATDAPAVRVTYCPPADATRGKPSKRRRSHLLAFNAKFPRTR